VVICGCYGVQVRIDIALVHVGVGVWRPSEIGHSRLEEPGFPSLLVNYRHGIGLAEAEEAGGKRTYSL
jgi:hypothetical protein